jgi:hypothetical protein
MRGNIRICLVFPVVLPHHAFHYSQSSSIVTKASHNLDCQRFPQPTNILARVCEANCHNRSILGNSFTCLVTAHSPNQLRFKYRAAKQRSSGARIFLVLLLITLTVTNSGLAKTDSCVIRGQVVDPSHAAIVGASVEVIASFGRTSVTTTNLDGAYEVKGLPPGRYTLKITAKGFADYANQAIELLAGQIQELDIALAILVDRQNVVVTETTSALDVSSWGHASSMIMLDRDLDALADDPDELESELNVIAGPTPGPSHNQLYLDGFTASHLPPKSRIREIRINQNPFSAEYEKMGYGRIEIFTKPGTDKVHGQFLVNGNSSTFNSRNPFVSQKPSYESTQVDGSVGGPINTGASFFFDVQHNNMSNEAAISAFVSDPNFNPVQLSQAFLSPGTRLHVGPRIDYQLGKNRSLTARYQFLKNTAMNEGVGQLNLASQAYDASETEHTLQLSVTNILSANTVNETRFQYIREWSRQAAKDAKPTISVLGAFVGGGNPLGHAVDTLHRYELQNNTFASHGMHLTKLGGKLRAYNDLSESTNGFNGAFTFSSLTAYQMTEQGLQLGLAPALIRASGGGASQFSITTGHPRAGVTLVDAAFHAEDEWRPRPNLTLSYGLRFETQNEIHDHADFAPRVALAWGIGDPKNAHPKTVVRAGFGVFYDRFTYDLALQAERLNGTTQKQFIVNSPDFFPSLPPASTLTSSLHSPTTYQIDPKLHAPYTMQTIVSLDRQISRSTTVAISYLGSRGVHQLLSRNINAPFPGTYNPSDTTSGVRPLGNIGNIYRYESSGVFKQNELVVRLNLHAGARLSLYGYYMLNSATSDTAGPSTFPSNQYNLAADYGRALYDIRHLLFVGGTIALPLAFRLSPFAVANSGAPFDINVGQDLNGDSIFNDRPAFATDPTRSSVVATRFGTFDKSPIPGEEIIPVNYGTGPSQFTVNMRLSKTFGFGDGSGRHGGRAAGPERDPGQGAKRLDKLYSLTFSVSARNILNHTNLAIPIGNLNSPLFGESNGLSGGAYSTVGAKRRIDLQLAFNF